MTFYSYYYLYAILCMLIINALFCICFFFFFYSISASISISFVSFYHCCFVSNLETLDRCMLVPDYCVSFSLYELRKHGVFFCVILTLKYLFLLFSQCACEYVCLFVYLFAYGCMRFYSVSVSSSLSSSSLTFHFHFVIVSAGYK